MMSTMCRAALILQVALPVFAHAAEPVSVELNGGEMADNVCRLTFVVENKNPTAVDSLKLDLFVFNHENRVSRRMLTEMGPVPREKTVVKLYAFNGQCADIHSILVNEITACPPAKADTCLDNIALTSRMQGVRFYK